MSDFGRILRELRTGRGLSQSDLASYIGVSKSSVNMYERGEREPSFETLEAIADCFNVDLDLLLGRKSPDPSGFQLWEISAYNYLADVTYSFYSQINSLLGSPRKVHYDILLHDDEMDKLLMDVEKHLGYLRKHPEDPENDTFPSEYSRLKKKHESDLRLYRKIIDKHKRK